MNEDPLEKISSDLNKIQTDLGAVKRAVMGEDEAGAIGLVKRVDRLEQWKESMVVKMASASGGVTVVILLAKWFLLDRK